MPYKTIVVVVPSPEAGDAILPVATTLADRFEAHLIGVHVKQLYEMYPGGAGAINLELYERLREDAERIAKETEDTFTQRTATISTQAEWRVVAAYQSGISAKLSDAALRADLVLMGAPDPEKDGEGVGRLHDLLIGTGRPVLMVPPGANTDHIGRNVLLCWSATREASLAAHNALGFLKTADLTTILTIGPSHTATTEEATEGHEMAKMLSRHGANTDVWHRAQEETTIGAQIVKEAGISGTDLIVMGAFGHSRLHDLLFTDATREVIRKATVPVLFSG